VAIICDVTYFRFADSASPAAACVSAQFATRMRAEDYNFRIASRDKMEPIIATNRAVLAVRSFAAVALA